MLDTFLFELTRGDDYTMRVEITDSVGTVVDITGWAFKATMKLSIEDTDADAPVSVDIPPLSGPDAVNGVVYITLPNAQTANLLPTLYYMDVQREINGSVGTVVAGRVRVIPDITQRTG